MVMLMGVTQAFLIGLAGQSLLEIAARAFYAQKNAKIPLLVSGLTVNRTIKNGVPARRNGRLLKNTYLG